MRCTYYRTLFRNQRTGYARFTVVPAAYEPFAKDGLIFCEGRIGFYDTGMPLILDGEYENSIFKVSASQIWSKGEEAIRKILDNFIDGLTEKQKKAVTDTVMGDLFEFAASQPGAEKIIAAVFPARVTDRELIAHRIIAKVNAIRSQEIMSRELLHYNVPMDRIELLVKKKVSLADIHRNPYKIFLRYDIPILLADQMAHNLFHISAYDELRLCEYATDAMNHVMKNGNTCCDLTGLTKMTDIRLSRAGVLGASANPSLVNYAVSVSGERLGYHSFEGDPYIYMRHVWEEENDALFQIRRLENSRHPLEGLLSAEEAESQLGFQFNDGQRNAFGMLKTSGLKILTGPPGSGKTAVIRGLLKAIEASGKYTVKLAATTGMAAKVMSKSAGHEAVTVNILLGITPFEEGIRGRGMNDPLDADFVIVDEVSMLGLQMFSALLKAVRSGATLILVGDEDQLQSVEYGNVLHDLIGSGCIETYRLTEIMRSSGTICENAQKINRGIHTLKFNETFRVYQCRTPEWMLEMLKQNYDEKKAQILCPVKKGKVSCASVSAFFQDNSAEILVQYGKKIYRKNDKIVMTRTDYDAGYTNGDMGYLRGIKNERLVVEFADRIMLLERQCLYDMDHADCITVHKSQGNEFEDVHIVLPDGIGYMMTQRILYTAVTRARKRVFIYSFGSALHSAIDNKGERKRITLLGKRLKKEPYSS